MKVMYYIAVLPPARIRKEIKDLKTEILTRFGSRYALRSPAHITLQMPFHFKEQDESGIIEALEDFAKEQPQFICEIDGFGYFERKTIFAEVIPNEELKNLRRSLQLLLEKSFGFNPGQLPQRFHPHITIANRDLKEENFDPCWTTFSERPYRRSFTVNQLTLLKHRGDHWDIYRKFPFTDA